MRLEDSSPNHLLRYFQRAANFANLVFHQDVELILISAYVKYSLTCGPLKKKQQTECIIFCDISTDRKMHPVKNIKIYKNCQIGGKMLHPVYFTLSWNFVAVSLANVEKALRQHPLPICRTKSHRLAAFL